MGGGDDPQEAELKGFSQPDVLELRGRQECFCDVPSVERSM